MQIELGIATSSIISSRSGQHRPTSVTIGFANLKRTLYQERFRSSDERSLRKLSYYFESREKSLHKKCNEMLEKDWIGCINLEGVLADQQSRILQKTKTQFFLFRPSIYWLVYHARRYLHPTSYIKFGSASISIKYFVYMALDLYSFAFASIWLFEHCIN